MTPEQWITYITVFVSLILGITNALPNLRKAKTDYTTTNIKSLEELSKQVNELIKDKIAMQVHNDNLDARIDNLEIEVRRWKNGYARAIRYIYDRDPLAEIPNFLETDPRLEFGKKK